MDARGRWPKGRRRSKYKDPARPPSLADKDACDDHAKVMKAVNDNGLCLKYASDRMKNDESIVYAAVSDRESGGMALMYASQRLRDKLPIVKRAVMKLGGAYEFAGPNLQGSREFVELCLKTGGATMYDVPEKYREDREMVKIAVEHGSYEPYKGLHTLMESTLASDEAFLRECVALCPSGMFIDSIHKSEKWRYEWMIQHAIDKRLNINITQFENEDLDTPPWTQHKYLIPFLTHVDPETYTQLSDTEKRDPALVLAMLEGHRQLAVRSGETRIAERARAGWYRQVPEALRAELERDTRIRAAMCACSYKASQELDAMAAQLKACYDQSAEAIAIYAQTFPKLAQRAQAASHELECMWGYADPKTKGPGKRQLEEFEEAVPQEAVERKQQKKK